MMEMVVLGILVLGLGMWTKRQNTLHMRRLHKEDYYVNAKYPDPYKKQQPPLGPSNKYLK